MLVYERRVWLGEFEWEFLNQRGAKFPLSRRKDLEKNRNTHPRYKCYSFPRFEAGPFLNNRTNTSRSERVLGRVCAKYSYAQVEDAHRASYATSTALKHCFHGSTVWYSTSAGYSISKCVFSCSGWRTSFPTSFYCW